jgi:hypothetical protein
VTDLHKAVGGQGGSRSQAGGEGDRRLPARTSCEVKGGALRTSRMQMVRSREPEDREGPLHDRVPTRPRCPPIVRSSEALAASQTCTSPTLVPTARCVPARAAEPCQRGASPRLPPLASRPWPRRGAPLCAQQTDVTVSCPRSHSLVTWGEGREGGRDGPP